MSVWKALSVINCTEHTEKKGQFSYLSWTWAWAMVKEKYPLAQYHIEPDTTYPDGTMEVRCTVTIEGLSHTMWLPVLDFKNKAIRNPNAFDVNSSRMRCLVKCLAMFGLGHYIYAGESVPMDSASETVSRDSDYTDEEYDKYHDLLNNDKAYEFYLFVTSLPHEKATALFNSFKDGKKSSGKEKVRNLENEGLAEFLEVVEKVQQRLADQDLSVTEITDEMTAVEKKLLMSRLSEYEVQQLSRIKKAQAA